MSDTATESRSPQAGSGGHGLAAIVLVGIALLVAGGFVGWLIRGGGSKETVTVGTVSSGTSPEATVTQTAPVQSTNGQTVATATQEQTVQVTGTKTPQLQFRGNGKASLPSIVVQASSTLKWQCPSGCGKFEVTSARTDNPRLSVSGSGKSGSAAVKKGTYKGVRVDADSQWSFTLGPGS